MKLTELQPEFLKRTADGMTVIPSIDEADGIWFLCPVCFQQNKGEVGTHHILCWRPHVPLSVNPSPGRWEFHGQGFENLTLHAASSSVLVGPPCNAHFFVKEGRIC